MGYAFSNTPFDKINAGHFKPAIIKAMEIHNKEIDKIIKIKMNLLLKIYSKIR